MDQAETVTRFFICALFAAVILAAAAYFSGQPEIAQKFGQVALVAVCGIILVVISVEVWEVW